MTIRIAPPSPAGPPLSEALARLSPTEIAIAELKALVGDGLNKGAFVEIVRASGVPTADTKAWSPQKVADAVQRLTAKGILAADGHISPAWRAPLTSRVALRPDGADLARRVRRAAPASWREDVAYRLYHGRRLQWPHYDPDLARSARLAAMAGDETQVEFLIANAEQEAKDDGCARSMGAALLRWTPLDPAFLSALTPGLRDRITSAAVEGFLERGELDEGVEAVIVAAGAPGIDWSLAPRLDLAMMRLDILGERPDAARERIARLRSNAPSPGVWEDAALALAGEAALAFLSGPGDGALGTFREALKQHRKALGKRKLALPAEFALFHVLALLAAGEPALHTEIAGLIEVMNPAAKQVASALECLLDLVCGQDQKAKTAAERLAAVQVGPNFGRDPFGVAVSSLALAVVEGANAARRARFDAEAVAAWQGHAPLAARILAQVHVRFPDPAQKRADWAAELKALGEGYPRRFLDIVPLREPWERTLEKLQGFLAPATKPPAAAPANAAKRLVFRLDAATGDITALEQSAKGGGWSAGRPIALKRLQQRDPKLDYLTPEDQRVAATVKLYRTYYDESYAFDPVRGPAALVGHPRVFDAQAPDQKVDLVAYPVELVVRETKKALRIDLSHRAERPQVVIEPEAPDRWRLIEVTQALVDLGAVLGPDGLEVPREARERVIGLIRTENPRLPVRSELEGVAGASIEGDPRPILRIVPEGGGFHLRAVVRPVGEAGPAYPPGQGSRSVLIADGGGHRRLERDLAAESAALEAVAGACPALAPWRDSDLDWRIEGLDAVLEALQELHACEAPVGLEWPQGAPLTPTRTVGARAMALNIASGKDWFEVKGQIQVDEDLVLDMAQVVERLGRAPGRFVPLDDGRYLALTEDLRRRLDALAAITESSKGGRRIGTVGAAALEEVIDGAGAVKADRRWAEMIARLGAARGYEPQVPATLQADLRDYQREGFAWMARLSRLGLGACLADDMGLGKTVQTLALLLTEAAKGPALVVAPTSVCHNWVLEAAKFAPSLRVVSLAGAPDRAALVEGLKPGDVLVASYGLLHTEADLLASRRFAVAVFDEAQNLKNAETRRAQASKRIDADFRLALSGTPLENRLDELWSLFDTVTPGLLGSREAFQRRFSGPIEKGHGAQARQALKALLRPYLLRRTKGAVLTELPSRMEITLEVEPGPAERAFYEALRRKALESLAAIAETGDAGGGAKGAGGQKRIRILAEITRLRRAACNPALIEPGIDVGSAKLEALLDLADELRDGRHRALVFSQFTGHLDLAEAALKARGVRLLRLDGSTPAKERGRLVEAFQAGEGELFLISLKAGGSGLNLTGADYVIHLDPWWNPAVEDQATDRAHRIGQTRPVTVYRLVVKDSIEEPILALHAAKRTLAADFLEDADAAGPLGEDELMALIRG